jgi:hypothetical protein
MNPDFVVAVVIPSMICFIFWTIFSTFRRLKVARVQGELSAKLLEKFSSGHELVEYMNSEAGKKFLESALMEPQQRGSPYTRILASVQLGIILAALGLALFLVGRQVPEATQGLVAFGTLVVTLGVGFLVSAAASYRLSKSFGLLGTAPESRA